MASKVAVLFTSPEAVLDDYQKLMELASWRESLAGERELLIKLNLSWTKYFPACSSQPWQLEGVVKTLLDGGYTPETFLPIENKTVVTNPVKGANNNLWMPVLDRYGCRFQPLTEVDWEVYRFKSDLLKLNEIFPEGIEIPAIYPRPGHPPPADGQDARPFHNDRCDQERVRRSAQGGSPLRAQVHPRGDGGSADDAARTPPERVRRHGRHRRRRRRRAPDDDPEGAERDPRQRRLGGDRRGRRKDDGFRPDGDPVPAHGHGNGARRGADKDIEIVGEPIDDIDFHFKTEKSLVIWGDQMLRLRTAPVPGEDPAPLPAGGVGSVRVQRVSRLHVVSDGRAPGEFVNSPAPPGESCSSGTRDNPDTNRTAVGSCDPGRLTRRRNVRAVTRAKVNLSLEVIRRRRDGYHEIETILQSISLADELTIEWNADAAIEISCSDPAIPVDRNNLCHRAVVAMRRHAGENLGARIHIEKRIPSSAGLGGGSANAAGVIVAVDRALKLRLPVRQLEGVAAQLGSDIPFMLHGGTMLGRGRGEVLTRLEEMKACFFTIVKPPVSVSTAWAYDNLNLALTKHRPRINLRTVNAVLARFPGVNATFRNELEDVVCPAHPVVAGILDELLATRPSFASMSGSGSALYAIYDNEAQAIETAERFSVREFFCSVATPAKRAVDISEFGG